MREAPAGAPGQGARREIRHGIFLRPGPSACARTLLGFAVCRRQFGFVAAAAYPPHMTILGSVDAVVPEAELIGALDRALAGVPAQEVRLEPLELADEGTYLGHRVADRGSTRLVDLMSRVFTAVDPLRTIRDGDFQADQRRRDCPKTFRPHVTVLGHDGADRPEALPDVLAFLAELGFSEAMDGTWETVALLRFASDDWTGRYWETMDWEIVRTWRLGR